MSRTRSRQLLTTGLVGTGLTAVCCFTPLLAIVFAVLGISAWLGWIDVILLPLLAFFVILTLYALFRRGEAPTR
ncbi:MAG: mercury resistance system transport protein MerF [Gammaproteobacteria bacterium]|nr:mercury resistance system transport protein MerF [Gammaproteobacteria bacterium]